MFKTVGILEIDPNKTFGNDTVIVEYNDASNKLMAVFYTHGERTGEAVMQVLRDINGKICSDGDIWKARSLELAAEITAKEQTV